LQARRNDGSQPWEDCRNVKPHATDGEPRASDDVPRLEACVLDTLARGEALDASALLFLLRRYRATPNDDLAEAVGRALAVALDARDREAPVVERSAWLAVFVEASGLSDDGRLRDAIADLVTGLRGAFRSPSMEQAAAAIGACLHAASLDGFPSLAADAIDELERLIGGAYHPGADLGQPADQVRAAFTLLLAYTLSGRLPYAMLAEELIQRARAAEPGELAITCEAARVLCRLAALHDDPEYRAAAVMLADADYRRDAARLLTSQAAEARRRGAAGAIYGLALLELESGTSKSEV
jgi:hypothetical protein